MKRTIVIFQLLILLAACNENKPAGSNVAEQSPAEVSLDSAQLMHAGIETSTLTSRKVSSHVKVHGRVDVPPQNMVSVSMPLGGFLKSTKLLPGMHIRKGEVIAVMEDHQYIELQQNYLLSKAQVRLLKLEFERQLELNRSKAASDKALQQAEASYKNQLITTRALSERLKLLGLNPSLIDENNLSGAINIHAPINGYVSKVNVNTGKYVNPTDVLFELVNPDDIHLSLTVFEKDMDKLFIGQKVYAYTNNQPGKKHVCEIILIGKDVSNERSIVVHCHFDSYDKLLVPGTYMNADIVSATHDAWVLPTDAIVTHGGKNFVFIMKSKGEYERLEVNTAITSEGFVEIIDPSPLLRQGSQVVVKGAYTLLMKMQNKEEDGE